MSAKSTEHGSHTEKERRPADRERVIIAIAAACVVAALFVGYMVGARSSPPPPSSAPASDPAAPEVSAGLAAADPAQAIVHFRNALAINPDHSGATFQLARALDRAGRADEARQVWQRVLELAEKSGDQAVVDAARARLGQGAVAADPDADAMRAGLELLHAKNDPAAAVPHFEKVLAHNPEHYGANYQLATALDRSGKPEAARLRWEKVLQLAEAIRDNPTADAARARLAQKP